MLLFFVLSVTRPKFPLGHIVSGTSNHATYDVYSPKAVKTLMYLKFYEYSTLYLEQNIFLFYSWIYPQVLVRFFRDGPLEK